MAGVDATLAAVVSRWTPGTSACVARRFAKLRLLGVAYLLGTSPNTSGVPSLRFVHLEPARLRGLWGSRSASRDAKQRFVAWAVATSARFEYVWHFEDDAVVDFQALRAAHAASTADLIGATPSANPFYTRSCELCRLANVTFALAWPAVRFSRRLLRTMHALARRESGHHEVLAAATCQLMGCRREALRDANIVLPHKTRRWVDARDRGHAVVHPVKCRPTTDGTRTEHPGRRS